MAVTFSLNHPSSIRIFAVTTVLTAALVAIAARSTGAGLDRGRPPGPPWHVCWAGTNACNFQCTVRGSLHEHITTAKFNKQDCTGTDCSVATCSGTRFSDSTCTVPTGPYSEEMKYCDY